MRTLLLILLLLVTATSYSQEWAQVAEDDKGNAIYIDKTSIRAENDYIYTCLRVDYVDDEYRSEYVGEYMELLKKHKYPKGIPQDVMLKWMKFRYTIYYMIYDISGNKSATVTIINYAFDHSVLSDVDLGEVSKFNDIEPDSLDAIVLDELLYYVKQGIGVVGGNSETARSKVQTIETN